MQAVSTQTMSRVRSEDAGGRDEGAESGSIIVRRREDRGHFDHGWLDTYHTFSFGDYHDPGQMGFRSLVVINEDRVQPGQGFGMHGHRDMEIITYVLAGELEHRDSMGNGSVLRAGDLQYMSAGTGVRHGEFNPSPSEPVHLYQIWLLPEQRGLTPGYKDLRREDQPQREGLRLIASHDGRDGSLPVRQNVALYLSSLRAGAAIGHELKNGRSAWLQVLRGEIDLDEMDLIAGDGAAISQRSRLSIKSRTDSEIMLFDLA